MSDYDERDKTEEEKRDDADSNSSLTNPETKEERKEEKKKESDYEDVCFMCRRPESKAGENVQASQQYHRVQRLYAQDYGYREPV